MRDIVRCKDCMWRGTSECPNKFPVKDECFCSKGERKSEVEVKAMDYCARESTLCDDTPVATSTVKMDVQETYKVLAEIHCTLKEFSAIVSGQGNDDAKPFEATCLSEEARYMTALAHLCLDELKMVMRSVV